MKINQIITESAITNSKAESILHLLSKAGLLDDSNCETAPEVIVKIVDQNPSTDLKQLFTMVKDALGDEVDEAGLSDKKIGRISKNKSRSFKKSLNKLKDISSTRSGRFDKNLINKLRNPVAEDEGL